ncbi:hypothetical protein M8J75_014874 [Diaphorina citri]|nr:hypothetical protein M8J75_014874 [Diaphorina citri]
MSANDNFLFSGGTAPTGQNCPSPVESFITFEYIRNEGFPIIDSDDFDFDYPRRPTNRAVDTDDSRRPSPGQPTPTSDTTQTKPPDNIYSACIKTARRRRRAKKREPTQLVGRGIDVPPVQLYGVLDQLTDQFNTVMNTQRRQNRGFPETQIPDNTRQIQDNARQIPDIMNRRGGLNEEELGLELFSMLDDRAGTADDTAQANQTDLDFLGLTDLLEGRIPDNAPSPAAARTEKRPSFQIPTKDNTHSTKDNTKDQGKDYTQDNRPGKECLCAMNRALQNPKGRAEPTRGPCYYELKRKGCFEAKRENCCTQCNCCAKSKTRYPCDPPPLPATKTTFIRPDRPDPSPAMAISAPSLEYTGVSEEDCCLPECVLCAETPCNFHDQMACEIFAKYCITDLKLPDTYEE